MSAIESDNKRDNKQDSIVEDQCKICLGVGLIKRKELKCDHCGSSVPFPLPYTPPYETCEACDGTGTEIIPPAANK